MSGELMFPINTTTLEMSVTDSSQKTTKRISKSGGRQSLSSAIVPSCASLSTIPAKSTSPSMNLCTPTVPRPFTTSSFSLAYTCPKKSLIDLRKTAAREKCLNDMTLLNAVKANYRFIYRINDGARTTNTILQKVCDERGWREFQESSLFSGTPYERAMRGATGWNLWWSYSIYQFSPYKYLRHWQFTNHNPKGFQFCNKLYLTMYLRKMRAIHGNIYDFYPLSFIIPEDFLRLSMEHSRRAIESFTQFNFSNLLGSCPVVDGKPPPPIPSITPIPNRPVPRARTPVQRPGTPTPSSPQNSGQIDYRFFPVWISKPVAQSQGKGIYLTTDLSTVVSNKKSVIQEYISRPLLIGGYKWDIRIYVCVSAIDPLVIYIYHEGLCRFCTEKYNTTDLTQVYSHLTNASLNKLSPAYEKDKELIGHGCKWPLKRLRQYFRERKISDWLMWQKIMAMVVLTVIGDSLRLGYSASNRNCFDLFGFDVLIDEDMKPWLLECNYSPGLGEDCETDILVKKPMLHELFDLLGFPDKASYAELERNTKKGLRGAGEGEMTEELGILDKDDVTRHYFDMVLSRLQATNAADMEKEKRKEQNWEWRTDQYFRAQDRLLDAKSIYSQNLVVQYLKNQSTGKISKQVRDQLISVATKKLRSKMTQIGGSLGATAFVLEKEKEKKKKATAISSDTSRTDLNNNNNEAESEKSLSIVEEQDPEVEEESIASSTCSSKKCKKENTITIHVGPEQPAKSSKKDKDNSLRVPDSEAFKKLKYYFDAGVDYPLDAKTGKFKEFPALLTSKKDWFNPPKQEGGWIRVYPFDARTTKSPYKSSLTDVRQAVRSIETYLKTAEHLSSVSPNESDDYYRRRMKTVCRRDTEIWIPPLGRPTSSATNTEDEGCSSLATQASDASKEDGWAPSLTENE